MDFLALKDCFINYFFLEFDHSLIDDKVNNPFVLLSAINPSAINPHRDSFGMYVIVRGGTASHVEFSTVNMARALVLEAKYITQKPSAAKPIEDELGYVNGFSIDKKQSIIISAVSNLEDARFVTKSVIHKLHTLLDKPNHSSPKTNPRT